MSPSTIENFAIGGCHLKGMVLIPLLFSMAMLPVNIKEKFEIVYSIIYPPSPMIIDPIIEKGFPSWGLQ
jgi:hypothetical protein